MDILSELNEKQREAVTAPMGPVLVLAGAGSGKTRALTYRIAYLIQKKLVRAENILAVTFTNKASKEMKQRVHALLGERRTENGGRAELQTPKFDHLITMGTFHSICVRILRVEIEKLGAGLDRNFTIYDSEDSKGLLKQIIIELDIGKEYKPQMFGYYISQAKNRLTEPRDLDIGKEYLQKLVQQVYEMYRDRLLASNALDFDDLLTMTVSLLQKNKSILEKYQKRFKYILVDEYQDTNHAQYLFLKLLSKEHQNIFVVGDDAQSIYGFRGANMQNILNFAKDYKKAKIVMLEQNYRSTQNILNSANKVIGLNPFQYEKDLWTENSSGEMVGLYEAVDETDESEHVLKRLLGESQVYIEDESYVDEESNSILDKFKNPKWMKIPRRTILASEIPSDLAQTAILYRTHAQSRAFEEAMMSAGIPYQIVGGIRFYERREIKDVLSYLRLVINPRDLVSLSRVINLPARGIGAVSFKVIKAALKKYVFLAKGKLSPDWSYGRLLNNIEKLDLAKKAQEGAVQFFQILEKARSLPEKKSLVDMMDLLLKGSGYKDSILDGTEEGEMRWGNIQELINVAAKFKSMSWKEGLEEFLAEVALMTDLDKKDDSENKLTMMTLHSAKGLEFDKVFFVGLEEGLLPHSRSIMNPEEISEEIRLAYVGMTRARKELYLSFAKSRSVYGEFKASIPSRILKAIPKKLLRKLE